MKHPSYDIMQNSRAQSRKSLYELAWFLLHTFHIHRCQSTWYSFQEHSLRYILVSCCRCHKCSSLKQRGDYLTVLEVRSLILIGWAAFGGSRGKISFLDFSSFQKPPTFLDSGPHHTPISSLSEVWPWGLPLIRTLWITLDIQGNLISKSLVTFATCHCAMYKCRYLHVCRLKIQKSLEAHYSFCYR